MDTRQRGASGFSQNKVKQNVRRFSDPSSSSTSSSNTEEEDFDKLKFMNKEQIKEANESQGGGSFKIAIFALLIILAEIMFKNDIFKMEISLIHKLREAYQSEFILEYI